jgi:hypothetical protein
MSAAMPPLPQYAFMAWCLVKSTGTTLPFYLYLLDRRVDGPHGRPGRCGETKNCGRTASSHSLTESSQRAFELRCGRKSSDRNLRTLGKRFYMMLLHVFCTCNLSAFKIY